MTLPNCNLCGRFVGYKRDYITWTDFGSYGDTEPPDESYAHLDCYNNCKFKSLIDNYTWQPPLIVKGNYGTSEQTASEDSQDQAGTHTSL